MSKKILKRSLALGALTAFVITGSAMAAEVEQVVVNSDNYNEYVAEEGLQGSLITGVYNNNRVIVDYGGDFKKWQGVAASFNNNGDSVTGNQLTINDGIYQIASWGGLEVKSGIASMEGDAASNRVVINGGTFDNRANEKTDDEILIVGGEAGQRGSAKNNGVEINDGIFNAKQKIIGGAVAGDEKIIENNGTAEGNVVIITGGEFNGSSKIGAGWGNAYVAANENIVTVTGGAFNGKTEIYGGRGRIRAIGNEVIIKNAVFNYTVDIYGGCCKDSDVGTDEVNNNIVTIGKGTKFNDVTNIYGANKIGVGNTLNITDGWNGKVTTIKNFNVVNINDDSKIIVTDSMELPKGATLYIADGNDYTGENYAITGNLTTNEIATLTIGNIKATTYNIATKYVENGTAWNVDIINDELLLLDNINTDGELQVTVKAQDAESIAENLKVSEGTADVIVGIITNTTGVEEGSAGAVAVDFVNNVMNNSKDKGASINSTMKMAESVGLSATAAKIMTNVGKITNDRFSFNCGHSAPHKGGHGVGLFEEGSGADIWVEYVHGKDKVEDMPSDAGATSYEGQYNGFVMGVDFKKVNKFQSGVAFNYGEGDTNSVGSVARTRSDYDFWGVGYYGSIHNDDSNVIFDVNYAKTDSDVTQENSGSTFEASPDTTTWSAGVKLEKLYQNENVQIVPYTGLRYMSIDSDDYSTNCGAFSYSMDRQDIWLLPLGVSIKQEVTNDNGWTVSPRVDLSYIWAFGDTNSNMEVKSPFAGVSQLGYDVMDDGSFLGLVGIEAHKGQWGFGVSYSYQKGDHSESKKWYVDANYSF